MSHKFGSVAFAPTVFVRLRHAIFLLLLLIHYLSLYLRSLLHTNPYPWPCEWWAYNEKYIQTHRCTQTIAGQFYEWKVRKRCVVFAFIYDIFVPTILHRPLYGEKKKTHFCVAELTGLHKELMKIEKCLDLYVTRYVFQLFEAVHSHKKKGNCRFTWKCNWKTIKQPSSLPLVFAIEGVSVIPTRLFIAIIGQRFFFYSISNLFLSAEETKISFL